MLSAFLEATTIHGLRYVSPSERPISRLAWAVCVAGSFTAAAIITYLNVVNWGSQPSVVTKVQVTHLKSLRVPMPTLTVCPQTPNFARLLVGYYKEHYNYGDSAELERAAKLAVVRQCLKHTVWKSRVLDGHEEFKPCRLQNTTSKACNLVKLLNAIKEVDTYLCDEGISPNEFVIDYAARSIVDRTDAGLAHLEEAYRDECVYAGPKEEKKKIPTSLTDSMNLARLYIVFHEFEEGGPIKGLDEFNQMKDKLIPNLQDIGDMGYLIGKMVSLGVLQHRYVSYSSSQVGEDKEFRGAVLNHFFREIMSGFEEVEVETPDDVLELMSYYAYDPDTLSVAKRELNKKYESPVQSGNVTIRVLLDSCDEYPKECQEYRNLTSAVATSKKNQDLIAELFRLSMGNFGRLESGTVSKSLLPGCSWDVESGICWDSMTTESGLCFTNYYRDDVILFNGTMNHGYLLDADNVGQGVTLRDVTSKWSVETSPPGYDVLVMQRGHFSTGRLTTHEEVVLKIPTKATIARFLDMGLSYASVVKTTPAFRGMAPDRRECLFPDEKKLRFFPEYSEPSCMLECAWDRAKESCGCIPWFLKEHYPESPLCEVAGNACFKKVVYKRYENPPGGCDEVTCPADCETAEFTFETAERDGVAYSTFCNEYMAASDEEKDIVCGHYDKKFSFLGYGSDWWNAQRKTLVYHNLNVRKKTAVGILLTATVSTIDMISNIGGTLGLFTGFSILSGVEVAFWVGKGGAASKKKEHMLKK